MSYRIMLQMLSLRSLRPRSTTYVRPALQRDNAVGMNLASGHMLRTGAVKCQNRAGIEDARVFPVRWWLFWDDLSISPLAAAPLCMLEDDQGVMTWILGDLAMILQSELPLVLWKRRI